MPSDPDQTDGDGLSVEAIKKLLAQHGLLIDEDDPVFRFLLANRLVLNAYFAEAEASFTRTSNRMKSNATKAIVEAERQARAAIQNAGGTIVTNAAQDLVRALREEIKPIAEPMRWMPYVFIFSLLLNLGLFLLLLFR
jgi:hypothetical protein